MKRQLSIFVSLVFLIILTIPLVNQVKATVAPFCLNTSLTRKVQQEHADLRQTALQQMDAADVEEEDSCNDSKHPLFSKWQVGFHFAACHLRESGNLILKTVTDFFFTPDLFLSNRTLRL